MANLGNDLKDLNRGQRDAVLSDQGPLLIVAGPGTGKTRVLISKILHTLNKGVKPERILAVTFSRRATTEMEERLLKAAPEAASLVEVSTLHSLCLDISTHHGFRMGLPRQLKLMTSAQAHLLFRRLARRLPPLPFHASFQIQTIVPDLLSFFEECKDEGLWPEDLQRWSIRLPDSTSDEQKIKEEWTALSDLYQAYQSYSFEEGWIDFGDALLLAHRLLQDYPQVRSEYQQKYDCILVDEFQDTNWIQIQFLRSLWREDAHIAVVGDDDQAIYRFRGASFSAFKFFKDAFSCQKVIELNETYRLSPSIAEVASTLISRNGIRRFLPEKRIQSRSNCPDPVQLAVSSTFEDEAASVLDSIQELLKQGALPSEIAILVRAHNHSSLLLELGKRRGLLLEAATSEALFDHALVKDCLAFLKLVLDANDLVAFLRLLDSPFLRLKAEEILKICRLWPERSTHVLSFLDEREKWEPHLSPEAAETILRLKQSVERAIVDAARMQPSELLMNFFESSQVIAHLHQSDPTQLRVLVQFYRNLFDWELTQKEADLRSAYHLLESLVTHETKLVDESDLERNPEAISVLTAHASKGLEFKHVFVMSLVSRRFPLPFTKNLWTVPAELRKEDAPSKESHQDEERRLLYVAMTRASESLTLTAIEKKGTKPSIFIREDLSSLEGSRHFKKIENLQSTNTALLEAPKAGPFSRVQDLKPQNAEKALSLSLSFSQLESYETCPLSYFFKYDLRLPIKSGISLTLGSLVHDTLEDFFGRIQRDQIPTEEQLLKEFTQRFEKARLKDDELVDRHLDQARKQLADFYRSHSGKFPKPLALEKSFEFGIGLHRVKGKIDRVDLHGTQVIIIDYKTGKPKNPSKKEDQSFAKQSLQLSIYALAAKKCFQWNVHSLQLYYLGSNEALSTERTDEDLKATEAQISSLAEQIATKTYNPTPGRHCSWCDYQRICPSAEKS